MKGRLGGIFEKNERGQIYAKKVIFILNPHARGRAPQSMKIKVGQEPGRHSGESRNPGPFKLQIPWIPDRVRDDDKNQMLKK